MKHFIITATIVFISISAFSQQSSPYVESGTLIINNSGFKSASLRATAITRPTPMHIHSDAVNATFPARFVVAKADLSSTLNWAQANGWNSSANSTLSGVAPSTNATGCALYSETGTGAGVGNWRLPTQREMNLIVIARLELAATSGYTQLGANRTYWTSTQNNATQAWAMTMTGSSMYPRNKTTGLYVRCIRDL